MTDFRFGPVELYLVGFSGDGLDPGTIAAFTRLIDAGVVKLLDLVIVSRDADGVLNIVEVEDDADRFGFGDVELSVTGIAGDADIQELAALVPPGSSAALLTLELAFARELAEQLAASGGVVLATERIPAPVVNALTDAFHTEGE